MQFMQKLSDAEVSKVNVTWQARSQDCQNEEADRSSAPSLLTSSPFPSPPLPSPPFLSPPLPLEVGPLNPARGSGERCKLPQRVWGGAPVEIDFGAF